MALNIKNEDVERLAQEVAEQTGLSKTQAIREALAEKAGRLEDAHCSPRGDRLKAWLKEQVWPNLPPHERGRVMSQEEREGILGIGPNGGCS